VRCRAAAVSLLAMLALASAAAASWHSGSGAGSAYAKSRSLPAGSTPTATVSNRTVTVSWTATGGAVPVDGYVVRRFDAGGTEAAVGAGCSGIVNALSCTETGVAPGTWRYTVTPARANWRGPQSAQSPPVTVNPPSLTLNTTNFTVLRATVSGQIQAFKEEQTVTFRLDNPSTGTILEGSIAPSPVPANGTASVSVTIPSGIANGPHTVYAVGSNGDQASANITVNTGSGFFATGSYTGNSADNRAISGLGFNPQVVIVKATTAQFGIVRTDTMSGDNSKPMSSSTALGADRIQSLTSDGFTLGTNAQVNGNGVSYRWMAFRSVDGVLKTGTYTGNGTSQSPSGLGFSPDQVGVFSAGAHLPQQRYTGMTRSFSYGSDVGITNGITALDANGFSVGGSATVNTDGTVYHYVAFDETPGLVETGSYTGNATDSRNITGVGVTPAYVQVRANDTATARQAAHRPSSLTGDSSLRYDASAAAANVVQALQNDGFQVGTDASVNATGVPYHYLAVRNGTPSPGCSSPGSATVTAEADSWVDQASPNSANGGAASLLVRSQALGNRRALVDFPLPAIPAGCSLTQATLNLFAGAASAGRTIDVFKAGASWTEGGVTWSNQPATTGSAASAASATGALSWDVTSQTQAQYSGTDTGFIVRDSAESALTGVQQTYQAREGAPAAQDPSLFVAWN
jgi:hypothetical protein